MALAVWTEYSVLGSIGLGQLRLARSPHHFLQIELGALSHGCDQVALTRLLPTIFCM